MSNTRHSMAREIIIDRLLSKPHGYSAREILKEVNYALEIHGFPKVSLNTIRNDIHTIQYVFRQKVIVERRSHQNYYYYEYSGNSIFKNVLTFDEIQHLHSALLSILFCDPIQGTLIYKDLSRRLSDLLDIDKADEPIVIYKRIPSKATCNKFKSLYRHIRSRMPVFITYESNKENIEQKIIVHPYFIMFDSPDYFLLGRDSTNSCAVKIPIKSISNISSAHSIDYIPNSDFILKDFYDNHLAYE